MGLNQWFEKGLTPESYMGHLDKHKEGFMHIYQQFSIPNDNEFFQFIKDKKLRVIALAEVWCGHCMFNIPVLLRLAEKTGMDARFLPRDENLELMDQYLTNGKSRSIPIFIFIDENGNEVAKWGPIAKKTKEFVDQFRAELPPKDASDYDEKFREMIIFMTNQFRDNSNFWYSSYDSMKDTLEKI